MQKKVEVSEGSVRRKAGKLGFKVSKSRGRTVHAHDHGEFMLVDVGLNACVIGPDYDATLSEIDTYLTT